MARFLITLLGSSKQNCQLIINEYCIVLYAIRLVSIINAQHLPIYLRVIAISSHWSASPVKDEICVQWKRPVQARLSRQLNLATQDSSGPAERPDSDTQTARAVKVALTSAGQCGHDWGYSCWLTAVLIAMDAQTWLFDVSLDKQEIFSMQK